MRGVRCRSFGKGVRVIERGVKKGTTPHGACAEADVSHIAVEIDREAKVDERQAAGGSD